MKKLTIFYLENCPYCRNAKRALEELRQENAQYAKAEVEWIEESKEAELAEKFDYYYVPAAFLDGRKLYEAKPGEDYQSCKQNVQAALDALLR